MRLLLASYRQLSKGTLVQCKVVAPTLFIVYWGLSDHALAMAVTVSWVYARLAGVSLQEWTVVMCQAYGGQ